MNGTRKWVGIAPVVTLCLILGSLTSLGAQTPAAGQDSGATKAPAYTLVEYNAEQACAAEKVPATQVKCLDDFVAKYPNSALLVYVYPLFVNAYNQLKNPQKVIEYADKLVAMATKRKRWCATRCFMPGRLLTPPCPKPTRRPAQPKLGRRPLLV